MTVFEQLQNTSNYTTVRTVAQPWQTSIKEEEGYANHLLTNPKNYFEHNYYLYNILFYEYVIIMMVMSNVPYPAVFNFMVFGNSNNLKFLHIFKLT